jgi:hypothetical protein
MVFKYIFLLLLSVTTAFKTVAQDTTVNACDLIPAIFHSKSVCYLLRLDDCTSTFGSNIGQPPIRIADVSGTFSTSCNGDVVSPNGKFRYGTLVTKRIMPTANSGLYRDMMILRKSINSATKELELEIAISNFLADKNHRCVNDNFLVFLCIRKTDTNSYVLEKEKTIIFHERQDLLPSTELIDEGE